MNLFSINEQIMLDMMQQAINEKAEQLASEKMLWTIKDLAHYMSIGETKLRETILLDPRLPKFKIGVNWRFPVKQTKEFVEVWALEQVEQQRYSYI